MQVQLLVTLDISKSATFDRDLPPDDVLKASACQAIRNALAHMEDVGFSHDLEFQTCIDIQSVQLATDAAVDHSEINQQVANPNLPHIGDLLDAIKQVESGGDATKIGDNGAAHGAYQIHNGYFQDAQEQLRREHTNPTESYLEAVTNDTLAREIVMAYMRRYAPVPLEDLAKWEPTRAALNCEIIARIHNGGPHGSSMMNAATLPYWAKVRTVLVQRGFNV